MYYRIKMHVSAAQLCVETEDAKQIAALSSDIFGLELPSLLLYVVFPQLLKREVIITLLLRSRQR